LEESSKNLGCPQPSADLKHPLRWHVSEAQCQRTTQESLGNTHTHSCHLRSLHGVPRLHCRGKNVPTASFCISRTTAVQVPAPHCTVTMEPMKAWPWRGHSKPGLLKSAIRTWLALMKNGCALFYLCDCFQSVQLPFKDSRFLFQLSVFTLRNTG
jgi:hypothetical protein